ncbi:MAG: VCBS repeat-containing protein [Prevotella sp.]|jgi:hypothetical protein|nr:VCBS repeat-containing protein [Prevotella sp.]
MKQRFLFSILLVFLLFSNLTYAQITLPSGVVMPDNIVEACSVLPPGTAFTVKELAATSYSQYPVDNNHVILTGDIDNDGYNEILVFGPGVVSLATNVLRIFKFKDNQITLQQNLSIPYTCSLANPMAIAKVNGNNYASIFICTNRTYNTAADQQQLIKYDFNGTQYVEAKRVRWTTFAPISGVGYGGGTDRGYPMIADLNGDGIPEVVVHDKVYNARTFELLADGAFYYNGTPNSFGNAYHTYLASMPVLADVDNDGVPEYIGGDYVYKINITNPNGTSGNSYTLWKQCSKTGHSEVTDGAVAVADMDNDGFLDVIVIVPYKNLATIPANTGALYVYNPRTGEVMHDNIVSGFQGGSQPFVGDIDNDGYPEICFTASLKMFAYDYNPTTRTLTKKWEQVTTDGSAATTMCMFDFNQDGFVELVYRDETDLRIIDGITGVNIATFPCTSSTSTEYPIVADINNDGSAEIIVTGGSVRNQGNGWLRVYTSNPVGSWAPARRVWNQFAYNAVNINNDLTVPEVQFNPATRFPGVDKILGNSDDVRPFNGYLMQQTTLDHYGMPLWLAPEAQIVGVPVFSYNDADDKMTITLQIKNAGDAIFDAPFYVTVYKDNVGSATKQTFIYNDDVEKGETISMTLTIPNFKSWTTYNFIVINLNDKGTGDHNQPVCKDDKSRYRYYGVLPTQQEVCLSKAGEMSCSFVLPDGTNTYQWQSSRDNITWADISGATAIAYTPTDQKRGILYYRVVVEDNAETINSVSVKVRVMSCHLPVNHNISAMDYYD